MEVDPPVPVLEHPPVPASIQDSDKAIEDLTVNPECKLHIASFLELTPVRRLFEPREARGYSFVAPTEPERIPVRSSPALLPPPPSPLSTLTKRRPSPEPAEESGDEIEFVGSSTPSRSRKRQRAKSPRKLKLDPVSNGTQSSPFSVPDTPLRELSSTLSPPSPSHRPRMVHHGGKRALSEDVRYRLARELCPAGG